MSRPTAVCVDLDGTLCNTSHRDWMLQEPQIDWDGYSRACTDDIPVPATVRLVELLQRQHTIIFISGRSMVAFPQTLAWLQANLKLKAKLKLAMRPEGSRIPNDQLKREMITEIHENGYEVVLLIEDNEKTKKALEEIVPVLLVARNGVSDTSSF